MKTKKKYSRNFIKYILRVTQFLNKTCHVISVE